MVIQSGREWLGRQWVKVTLYFHQKEQIANRLHHGLSETILMNTLTDVREFKNVYCCNNKKWAFNINELNFTVICFMTNWDLISVNCLMHVSHQCTRFTLRVCLPSPCRRKVKVIAAARRTSTSGSLLTKLLTHNNT